MNRIFKDPAHEVAITAKGYTVIKDFASDAVCDELYHFYGQYQSGDARAFTISNWNNNTAYREAAYDKISTLLRPLADDILQNYKPVLSVYTAKNPVPDSAMVVHQDWSLVDESKYCSVSIWLALCDMTADNGYLQVAEYSHIYASQPRGMNIPEPFENIKDELLKSRLTGLAIKKGDAIVFDHRLIHASPPNRSPHLRLAAVMALIPAEADLIHYYREPDNNQELEILQIDESKFRIMDFFDAPNRPPHIKVSGHIPIAYRQITMEDISRVHPIT